MKWSIRRGLYKTQSARSSDQGYKSTAAAKSSRGMAMAQEACTPRYYSSKSHSVPSLRASNLVSHLSGHLT